ncbi:glycosyltransferase family 2 protein [Chloroflexi bacterium TSY]|nr:glycosyltransferase family 2 protein [Chloroflexi bacterium TSY]
MLYLAYNRLTFTKETFNTLVANTEWQYVHELFVYDDGSTDGTFEWLEEAIKEIALPIRLMRTNFNSPVAAMVHFIESATAPMLGKIDNDVMLPVAWLGQSLSVFDRHPELALLGLEALHPYDDDVQIDRTYQPAEFVSGLGLYRRSAFSESRPQPYGKWFGFEEWQSAQGNKLKRGWLTPAMPLFLLDRLPFEPWFTQTKEYVKRGWQRQWPPYEADSTLWHWRWPKTTEASHTTPPDDVRFLAAMRIKNEAAYIHEVLSSVLTLCQRVLILDDHSTDESVAICRSFGERITIFSSPFEGLDEARDKNYLLQKIIEVNPEWVLWIDGDEVLEQSGADKIMDAVNHNNHTNVYSLRIAYLWNDAHHVRVDGIYGQFRRPSLFRLRGQSLSRLQFAASGYGGNFHCGNVPQGLVGNTQVLDVRLKHYGYMNREQRQTKYKWYTANDPDNSAEDHYRHLAEIPGARYAPGPAQIVSWVE